MYDIEYENKLELLQRIIDKNEIVTQQLHNSVLEGSKKIFKDYIGKYYKICYNDQDYFYKIIDVVIDGFKVIRINQSKNRIDYDYVNFNELSLSSDRMIYRYESIDEKEFYDKVNIIFKLIIYNFISNLNRDMTVVDDNKINKTRHSFFNKVKEFYDLLKE